jgi:hypothetical protein
MPTSFGSGFAVTKEPKMTNRLNCPVLRYDVISGPAGKKCDWDRMRSLFVPGARLIPTGPRPTGGYGSRVLTVDEYI